MNTEGERSTRNVICRLTAFPYPLLAECRTGGASDGNFTAALGIPTLDGLGADGKGAHAAYEQSYFSSLMPRTYFCARLLETLE